MSAFLATVLPYLLSAIAGVVAKHVFPNIPVPFVPGGTPAPAPAPVAPAPVTPTHPILAKLTAAGEAWLKAQEQAAEDALMKAILSNLPNSSVPAAPIAPAPKS